MGKVGFDTFQKKMVTHSFWIDGNKLSRAKSLLGMVKNDPYSSLCNTQQLTQPPLPLRWQSTPQIGDGSAFFVRRHGAQLFSDGVV